MCEIDEKMISIAWSEEINFSALSHITKRRDCLELDTATTRINFQQFDTFSKRYGCSRILKISKHTKIKNEVDFFDISLIQNLLLCIST